MKCRILNSAAVLFFSFVLFSSGLALGASCESKDGGSDESALGAWYTTMVWDSTDIESTCILGSQKIQMLSYDLNNSMFVWGLIGTYTESEGVLTITVTDGYMEEEWMDSDSANWNNFLATTNDFWGSPPYSMNYSVSGSELTLTMQGDSMTYTQASASLNHIGAWYMTQVVESSNIKTTCTMDRHHFQMLSFDLDNSGVLVWGVRGSYTTGNSTITVALEEGYDGIDWIDDQSEGWSSFITDLEPYWGTEPYTFTVSASETVFTMTVNGQESQFTRY